MGHVYEDDRCGSGLLYLAAGCYMTSLGSCQGNAIAQAAPGGRRFANGRLTITRRPAGFDLCAAADSSSISSSSGEAGGAQAAVEAAARAAVADPPGWFASSGVRSSGSSRGAADARRAEVLAWAMQAAADLPLDLSVTNQS